MLLPKQKNNLFFIPLTLCLCALAILAAMKCWEEGGFLSEQNQLNSKVFPRLDRSDPLLKSAQINTEKEGRLTTLLGVLSQRPFDARGYIYLALFYEEQGHLDKAASLMETAGTLSPREPNNQFEIAKFYRRQHNMDQALNHWGIALESTPWNLIGDHFDDLLFLLKDRSFRDTLTASVKKNKPLWWDRFMHHIMWHSTDRDLVKAYYHLNLVNDETKSRAVDKHYVDYMIGQSDWVEAYTTWLSKLDEKDLPHLGYIFDGGFDGDMDQGGFGWQLKEGDGATRISFMPLKGSDSNKLLRVDFGSSTLPTGNLVSQFLMLDGGRYQLKGLRGASQLKAGDGVRWQITCQNGLEVLRSGGITGDLSTRPWKDEFVVPSKDCKTQTLSLSVIGSVDHPFGASGGAWFDNLTIERLGQ